MTQENSAGDSPGIKITKKKVDQSWKEEVRKERELANAAPAKPAAGGAKPAAPGAQAPAGNEAPEAAEAPAGAKGAPANSLFVNFVGSLVQQALMQLGQMENPFTGRREVDLEGAKQTIDLLNVLKEKTKGNLAEAEEKTLGDAARELQFYFVEIAKQLAEQMKGRAGPRGPGAGPR
ncbi:MAG: hypothetical protein AMXMBFR7_32140 [Planctomycetota bacterium]